jgi:hypothetical protein
MIHRVALFLGLNIWNLAKALSRFRRITMVAHSRPLLSKRDQLICGDVVSDQSTPARPDYFQSLDLRCRAEAEMQIERVLREIR